VSGLIPHTLVPFLHPEDHLATGKGDEHALADRVWFSAHEGKNIAQEGFDALVHRGFRRLPYPTGCPRCPADGRWGVSELNAERASGPSYRYPTGYPGALVRLPFRLIIWYYNENADGETIIHIFG
jgi:hypothetical protein